MQRHVLFKLNRTAEVSPSGVVVNVLDCDVVGSELELQLPYYVHFWTNALRKDKNLLISSNYGLVRTTTVLQKLIRYKNTKVYINPKPEPRQPKWWSLVGSIITQECFVNFKKVTNHLMNDWVID